jgi:hypothetical protein
MRIGSEIGRHNFIISVTEDSLLLV